jgi:uncharacterized protein YjbJ (UPF0337 family)
MATVALESIRQHWRNTMNRDRIKDVWPDITGKLRRRWSKLTMDDVSFPGGSAEYLAGVLQDRYGVDRREALLQVYEFESEL